MLEVQHSGLRLFSVYRNTSHLREIADIVNDVLVFVTTAVSNLSF